jgi:endogenous inhibitor of DNA gyrase (YacG/DUF329 family)
LPEKPENRAILGCVRIECPTCKAVLADVPDDYGPRPFCSPRCKLADLYHWLNEDYRVSEPVQLDVLDERSKLN